MARSGPAIQSAISHNEKVAPAAELLQSVLATLKLQLPPDRLALLTRHFDLLLRWNRRLSLTAIRQPEEIAIKHFGESLFLATRLAGESGALADIGSGGGFPGFPVAVAVPGLRVTLVESNAKKAAFLKEVARGVSNANVYHGRFETLAREFDWVCLRGVAPEPLLAQIAKKTKALAILTGAEEARKLSSHGFLSQKSTFELPWPTGRELWMFHVER
jgi:16S rRNA (guanine(527)-N(7))-methyltransferase RsmG